MIIDNDKTIRFGQFFHTNCKRRYVRAHNTIQNSIGQHLQSEGFEVVYEWKDEDEDSSYRYDIIAQKKKELWVVEVKDVLDIRNFGQVYAYILQIKKENPTSKVWLGTDCKNYWELIEGEIGQMTENLMKKEDLGIILINTELIWTLPTHSDLLNIQEKGHLCEDCGYCKRLWINGAAYKILSAVEEGKNIPSKITEKDEESVYEYSQEEFKDILKDFRKIKTKMGKAKFESTTGIKLE